MKPHVVLVPLLAGACVLLAAASSSARTSSPQAGGWTIEQGGGRWEAVLPTPSHPDIASFSYYCASAKSVWPRVTFKPGSAPRSLFMELGGEPVEVKVGLVSGMLGDRTWETRLSGPRSGGRPGAKAGPKSSGKPGDKSAKQSGALLVVKVGRSGAAAPVDWAGAASARKALQARCGSKTRPDAPLVAAAKPKPAGGPAPSTGAPKAPAEPAAPVAAAALLRPAIVAAAPVAKRRTRVEGWQDLLSSIRPVVNAGACPLPPRSQNTNVALECVRPASIGAARGDGGIAFRFEAADMSRSGPESPVAAKVGSVTVEIPQGVLANQPPEAIRAHLDQVLAPLGMSSVTDDLLEDLAKGKSYAARAGAPLSALKQANFETDWSGAKKFSYTAVWLCGGGQARFQACQSL